MAEFISAICYINIGNNNMKSAKKVKIDREVLFELLSIYRDHEGDKMIIKTIDP